jgi:hypothetical protein
VKLKTGLRRLSRFSGDRPNHDRRLKLRQALPMCLQANVHNIAHPQRRGSGSTAGDCPYLYGAVRTSAAAEQLPGADHKRQWASVRCTD